MKTVSVFGMGDGGAVTAACLAHKGHRVVGSGCESGEGDSTDLEEVVRRAEVFVVGAKTFDEEAILAMLGPNQLVVDLRRLRSRSVALEEMACHQMASA